MGHDGGLKETASFRHQIRIGSEQTAARPWTLAARPRRTSAPPPGDGCAVTGVWGIRQGREGRSVSRFHLGNVCAWIRVQYSVWGKESQWKAGPEKKRGCLRCWEGAAGTERDRRAHVAQPLGTPRRRRRDTSCSQSFRGLRKEVLSGARVQTRGGVAPASLARTAGASSCGRGPPCTRFGHFTDLAQSRLRAESRGLCLAVLKICVVSRKKTYS